MGERVTTDADLDGSGLRIGVCCGRFNRDITDRLLAGALAGLVDHGVAEADVLVRWAPGAYELPLVAQHLVGTWGADAVIALGAVIRGRPATTTSWPASVPPACRGSSSTPASRWCSAC